MSSGVKMPVREVNHSPPSSVEVKNEWSYTSVPPIYLRGVDRDNFAFFDFAETFRNRPDRIWDPPSLRVSFLGAGEGSGQGLALNTHPRLMPRLKKE